MTYIEFKPGEKHAGTGAETSESIDTFRDCGYLIQDDEVVLDFDTGDKELLENMIQWFHIKTELVWTDRGVHLYYKKPGWLLRTKKDYITALGIPVEMKTSKNCPNGITRKRNGVARKAENVGNREELPKIFDPYPKKVKYQNLVGLGEGDGRNNKLYRHKMDLKNCDGWENILRFINNYVFAEPLSEQEYAEVTRTENVRSDESQEYLIATRFLTDYRCVYYSGLLWFYDGEEYVTDEKDGRLIRLIYAACKGESTRFIDEVLKQIRYRAPIIPNDTVFSIRFENGYLTKKGNFIEDDEYLDFTPYYINIDYNPNAEPVKVVDDYINALTSGDPDYKMLLEEVLSYVLIVDPERVRALGKFFMFRGDGANGKGTLLQIMEKIYNQKNCTNLSIKQLADDRFKVTMIGKLANLGDDIEPEAINNDQLKILKNITTADTVSTRKLYAQSQSAKFTTKLYFTTNSDIKSFEKGYAYRRRILWLPMFNKVKKPDPNFITTITTPKALEYWIALIMKGYRRLYENQGWTECQKVKEYNNRYHESNNPVVMFLEAVDLDTEIIGHTIGEVRNAYKEWDGDEDFKSSMSGKLLKQALWDNYKIGLGTKKINGKAVRVFMHQEDTTQDISQK